MTFDILNCKQEMMMSSREITEVLRVSVGGNPEQRHDNVKRTIERLHKANALTLSSFTPLEENRISSSSQGGRPATEYMLNKLDSITVVAQLNPVVTAAIVKRWDELENSSPQLPNFNNPVEAARAWADAQEQAVMAQESAARLEAQAAQNAPKVEFADAVTMSDDSMLVREAAKVLGTGQNRLYAILRRLCWVQRNNEPYQCKIHQGLLDVKIYEYENPYSGEFQVKRTTIVTAKGLSKLHSEIQKLQQRDLH